MPGWCVRPVHERAGQAEDSAFHGVGPGWLLWMRSGGGACSRLGKGEALWPTRVTVCQVHGPPLRFHLCRRGCGGLTGLAPVLQAILLPVPCPAHGLWCQDCTLTTNSSHCTPKQCQPSDTVCASVRITDPSSSRKDHSVNKMCASSCDFVKRHFFSDYLMGFINSGILKVDVDCCEKDLCNGVARAGRSPWALAGGLLLSLGPALLWAGP
nr:lymphocyte antigen 6H [Vicugna pacos]